MATAAPVRERARQDRVQRPEERSEPSPRIAYLLSQYPARSHTFFLNEILGLRERGLHIQVASINPADRALNDLPPGEVSEARQTFYVKQAGRMQALFAVAATALRRPAVVVRGLRAIGRLPSLSLRQRAFWLFYLAEAILVGRWMRQNRLPHLHVHFGGAVASVGMLTSIAWRVPFSLTIHGPEELLDPTAHQLAAKLRQASFVVCISAFCRNELTKLLPQSVWSRLSVIRLGVDPFLLAPAADTAPLPQSPLTLACVGRLVPEKGHLVLLKALHLLHQRGLALQAVLIGAGPLDNELRRYVAEHGLEDRVRFTSGLSHAETLAHVRAAGIFALASFAEGVPVALMEAMSLGIPCVSTTVAGIPELIQSGESGLLVPPGDPAALADALESLVLDGTLRHSLGKAGRERVIREYNLPRNLDALANHFSEQLAQTGPAYVRATIAASEGAA